MLRRKLLQIIHTIILVQLVELFPCESKTQLLERETWYITEHKNDELCLNTRNPITNKHTPESKQEHKEKCRKYYQQHREEMLQKRHEYQLENREKKSEYNKNYTIQNAERLKEYNRNYIIENRERRNWMKRERYARRKQESTVESK